MLHRCCAVYDAHELMSKALLFTLAAAGNLIVATLAFRTGRFVLAIVLVAAAFSFAMAALGAARNAGGSRR